MCVACMIFFPISLLCGNAHAWIANIVNVFLLSLLLLLLILMPSAQAQMTTCAAGSQIPIAGADANAWVSVTCQAKDFYAASNHDDDDDNWLTDSATGQGYLAAAVLLSVLCVVLAVIIRSEEHTSELQSLMRISYAVFCLKKK